VKIIFSIALLFSLSATAGEVTEFKPRPAVVEQGDSSYVGILLSEEDFRKMLQDKLDTNAKIAECSVDRQVCTRIQDAYKTSMEKLQEDIKKENTWFNRNKGTLGLLSGLVIGVGTSVAIARAVNGQ
jgi:hypothetical protein